MDQNFLVYNSGTAAKVCSEKSFTEVLKWMGPGWRKEKEEVCYQNRHRRHYSFCIKKQEGFFYKLANLIKKK